jgi:hypothetical protein
MGLEIGHESSVSLLPMGEAAEVVESTPILLRGVLTKQLIL